MAGGPAGVRRARTEGRGGFRVRRLRAPPLAPFRRLAPRFARNDGHRPLWRRASQPQMLGSKTAEAMPFPGDSFVLFWAFQWLTRNPNQKKMLSFLAPPPAL